VAWQLQPFSTDTSNNKCRHVYEKRSLKHPTNDEIPPIILWDSSCVTIWVVNECVCAGQQAQRCVCRTLCVFKIQILENKTGIKKTDGIKKNPTSNPSKPFPNTNGRRKFIQIFKQWLIYMYVPPRKFG